MRAASPGGSGVPASRGSRRDPGGMGAVDRAVDYEARVRPVLEADRALVRRALAVLYGDGGAGGVAKGIGLDYAEAVRLRACEAMTWDGVAERLAASSSTARRWYAVAMDYIDAVGLDGAAEGAEA